MTARRNFVALVGGLAIGGPVLQRASFAKPTLILPPGPTILPPPADAAPLLTLQHIQRLVPDDAFQAWMRCGLSMAKQYGGRDEQAVQASTEAAVAKHGSVVAAMRAGAI